MDADAEPITLRQSQAVWVPIVIWLLCALSLGDAIVEGSTAYALRVLCVVATIAYIAFIGLAQPCLRVDSEGVTIANVLHTNRIPFGALTDIRVGGLTSVFARTGDGSERKITSWNAPGVPRRPPRERGPLPTSESEVERLIRNHWEAWRVSNPHDDGQSALIRQWNARSVGIAMALIALNIAIGLRW